MAAVYVRKTFAIVVASIHRVVTLDEPLKTSATTFGGPGHQMPRRPCTILTTTSTAVAVGQGLIAAVRGNSVAIFNLSDPRVQKCQSGWDTRLSVPGGNIKQFAVLPGGAIVVAQSEGLPYNRDTLWLLDSYQVGAGIGKANLLKTLHGVITSMMYMNDAELVVSTLSPPRLYFLRMIASREKRQRSYEYGVKLLEEVHVEHRISTLCSISSDYFLAGLWGEGEVHLYNRRHVLVGIIATVPEIKIESIVAHYEGGHPYFAVAAMSGPIGFGHVYIYRMNGSIEVPWKLSRSISLLDHGKLEVLPDGRLVIGTAISRGEQNIRYQIVVYGSNVWDEDSSDIQQHVLASAGEVITFLALPHNYLLVGTARGYVDVYSPEGLLDGSRACNSMAISGGVKDMALLPGLGLAVGADHGDVQLFNLTHYLRCRSHQEPRELIFHKKIHNVASLGGKGLAVHADRSTIYLFNATSLVGDTKPYASIRTALFNLFDMTSLKNGLLVTLTANPPKNGTWRFGWLSELAFYRTKPEEISDQPFIRHQMKYESSGLAVLSNGDLAVYSSGVLGSNVCIFDGRALEQGEIIYYSLSTSDAVSAIAARHDGGLLVGTYKGAINVFRKSDMQANGTFYQTIQLGCNSSVLSIALLPNGSGVAIGLQSGDVQLISSDTLASGSVQPFFTMHVGFSVLSLLEVPEINALWVGGRIFVVDPVQDRCMAGTFSPESHALCEKCPDTWTSAPGSSTCSVAIWTLGRGTEFHWTLLTWLPLQLSFFAIACCPLFCRQWVRRVRRFGLLAPVFAAAAAYFTPTLPSHAWRFTFGIEPDYMPSSILAMLLLIFSSVMTNYAWMWESSDKAIPIILALSFNFLVWQHLALVLAATKAGIPLVETFLGYAVALDDSWKCACVNILTIFLVMLAGGAALAKQTFRIDDIEPVDATHLLRGSIVMSYSPSRQYFRGICKYRLSWRGKHIVGLISAAIIVPSFAVQLSNVSDMTLTRSRGCWVIASACMSCVVHAWSLLVDTFPSRLPPILDSHFRASTLLRSIIVAMKLQFANTRVMEKRSVVVSLPPGTNLTEATPGDIDMNWSCYGNTADPGSCPSWCVHDLQGQCLWSAHIEMAMDKQGCFCHYSANLERWKIMLTMLTILLSSIVLMMFGWGGVFKRRSNIGEANKCRYMCCLTILLVGPQVALVLVQWMLALQDEQNGLHCFADRDIRYFAGVVCVLLLTNNECRRIMTGYSSDNWKREAIETPDGYIVLRPISVILAFLGSLHFFVKQRKKCPISYNIIACLFAFVGIAVLCLPMMRDASEFDSGLEMGAPESWPSRRLSSDSSAPPMRTSSRQRTESEFDSVPSIIQSNT